MKKITEAMGDMHISPLADGLGAQVMDVNLSSFMSAASARNIRRLVYEHQVLLLRQQELEGHLFVKLARYVGKPESPFQSGVHQPRTTDGYPEIYVITNRLPDGGLRKDNPNLHFWHSDASCNPRKSTDGLISLLQPVELPKQGGATEFASLYQAYESLPPDLRSEAERRSAVHSLATRYMKKLGIPRDAVQGWQDLPAVILPLVRQHPVTSRPLLFVSDSYVNEVVDLDETHAEEFLQRLHHYATAPNGIYRHEWQYGDVLLWDNLSVIHRSTRVPVEPRTMHLIKVTTDMTED